MNIFYLFKKKTKKIPETGRFAEFFIRATPKEKIKVFTKAAEMANDDQRKLFKEVEVR